MDRRTFLTLAGALAVTLPLPAWAAPQPYTPGLAEAAMQRGERIVLMFSADWCSTCRRQERIISALRAANPAIDRDLTVIRIDWDEFGDGDLARRFAVPRRSTLIALRGEVELDLIVAGTSEDAIRALFERALAG
jgi:thiol-disulfide isomerase/thioredoxin